MMDKEVVAVWKNTSSVHVQEFVPDAVISTFTTNVGIKQNDMYIWSL